MKRLCTICARGGSKGIKNKNLRILCGKPLIAHSLLQAKRSGLFDAIAVSSDAQPILSAAEKWGADYCIRRPRTLATDRAPKLPAIQHCAREAEALSGLRFDTFVDLDATAPLRIPQDLRESVRLLETSGASNLVTAMAARKSPYFNMLEINAHGFVRLCKKTPALVVRRQDAPECFDMNASIYIWRRSSFFRSRDVLLKKTLLYVMPEDRSIDIDTELDFKFVEFYATQRGIL
ncbi:MAG: acylneuraminate cytidylyltransferase family protein [Candidatus Omnitrophota bacterium]|jgi:N-acylneuraminate cytidylyltransferase/CMP-N,N'-diacetyllegionaminic acid synthase